MLQPLCRVHKRMVFRPSEEAKFTNTKKERKLLDRKRIVGRRVQKTSLVYISFLEPTKCEGNRRRKPPRMLPNGLSEKKKGRPLMTSSSQHFPCTPSLRSTPTGTFPKKRKRRREKKRPCLRRRLLPRQREGRYEFGGGYRPTDGPFHFYPI